MELHITDNDKWTLITKNLIVIDLCVVESNANVSCQINKKWEILFKHLSEELAVFLSVLNA